MMLLGLRLILSAPAAAKSQYFVHLSFISTLKLINGISNDGQKLRRYFNGIAYAAFLIISFNSSATVCFRKLIL